MLQNCFRPHCIWTYFSGPFGTRCAGHSPTVRINSVLYKIRRVNPSYFVCCVSWTMLELGLLGMILCKTMVEISMRGHQVLNTILNRHLGKFGISGYSDEHTNSVKNTFKLIDTLPKDTRLNVVKDYGDLCHGCKFNPACYVKPERDDQALVILEETLGIVRDLLTLEVLYTDITLELYCEIRDKMYPPS